MRTPSATGGAISAGEGRRAALLLAVPLALTVAVYAGALSGPFLFDDHVRIVENADVRSVGRYLSARSFAEFLSGGRPLTNLTFALNYAAARLDPWSYHLANVAIHLIVVVLVFAFTARIARLAGAQRRNELALAVAGIFALHPIQTEAAAYIVQRAELLTSGLYLSVLLLLLAAERHRGTRRGAIAWAGSLLAYAAGLAAKQIVITAPLAHLLVAAAVTGTPAAQEELASWRRRLVLVAPLLALGAGYAGLTLLALRNGSDVGFAVPDLTPASYLATELRVLPVYLRLLIWPSGQNVDWRLPASHSFAEPRVLVSTGVLLALGLGALGLAARARLGFRVANAAARLGALGVGWFFLVLSVTSTVVPLPDVFAEHRLYLASWGIFLACAAAAQRAIARLGTRRGSSFALLVAGVWIALAVATQRRNLVWQSSEALWRDAVQKAPWNPRAYCGLGLALQDRNRVDEALAVYSAGLEHARGHERDAAELELGRGLALRKRGQLEEATRAYSAGLEHARRQGGGIELRLLENLAIAHAYAGRIAEAVATYGLALEKKPRDPEILGNLASGLLVLGDLERADQFARRAVTEAPERADAWSTVSAIRLERHDPAGALDAAQRALALDPGRGVAHFDVGRALAALGRAQEACRAWREALRLPLPEEPRAQAESFLTSTCAGF